MAKALPMFSFDVVSIVCLYRGFIAAGAEPWNVFSCLPAPGERWGSVLAVACSPRGDRICASYERSVRVFDGADGKHIRSVLSLNGERVFSPPSLAFLNDSTVLVSGFGEYCVLACDLDTAASRSLFGLGFSTGMAVDRNRGLIYIVEGDKNRLQVLTTDGRFLRLLGDKFGDGQLNGPRSAAITSSGDVVVTSGSGTVAVCSRCSVEPFCRCSLLCVFAAGV